MREYSKPVQEFNTRKPDKEPSNSCPCHAISCSYPRLALFGSQRMIAELLQNLPGGTWELVQFYHDILERCEEPVDIALIDIQRRQNFDNGHGMTCYLGKNMMIVKKRKNDCLSKKVFIHLVDHCPRSSQ